MGRHFSGKVVLITGGASGLGEATALQLATEGARLALVDVDAVGLERLAGEIERVTPGAEVLRLTADVSNERDVGRYVAETKKRFGRIDGFFNNAGIQGEQTVTENYSSEEFDRVVAANLRGVFLGLKHVLGVMRDQGSGAVVNTASVGGIRGVPNHSGYSAAKHGVVGLTRNSGVEYGQYGITVNAIAPGGIMTPMIEASLKHVDSENWEEVARQIGSANPMGRLGRAEEVARLVSFLLSDDNTYINATVIAIDGGQSEQY